MLGGVGNIGTLSARRRVIAAAGGGYTPPNAGPETNTYAYDIDKIERENLGEEYLAHPEASPAILQFNSNGTKLHLASTFQGNVIQHNLTTPYDISTADSGVAYSFENFGFEKGFFYNHDGTKLFVTLTTDVIYQYSLATAYQPTTSDSSTNVNLNTISGGANSNTNSGSISTDGTLMHIFDPADEVIYQYAMTTGFDFSTISLDGTLVADSGHGGAQRNFAFNGDGTKLYLLDNDDEGVKIKNYTLSTAFDITTKGSVLSTMALTRDFMGRDPEYLEIKPDGTKLYLAGGYLAVAFDVSIAHDLSSAIPKGTDYYQMKDEAAALSGSGTNRYLGADFNTDGTKLLFFNGGGPSIISVNLSTPYSITSGVGTTETSSSLLSEDSSVRGMFLKPDGTRFYTSGSSNDKIFQYDMSTAFDVTSTSYNNVNLDVSGKEATVSGITFKPDGTKMFITGFDDDLQEYALSTPWDLSTASFTQTLSNIPSNPFGIAWNSDGTVLYCSRSVNGLVKLNFSSAYDISTYTGANFDSTFMQDFNLQKAFYDIVWAKNGEIMLSSLGNKIVKFVANDKRMIEQIYSPEIITQSPISSADDTRNYNVLNIEFRADTNPSDYKGRLFIGHKLKGHTAFDLCVGAVQILNSSSARVSGWQGSDFTTWDTTTNEGNSDPANYVEVLNYFISGSSASIASGSTDARWNVASSTADLNTGAADGVATTYGSGGSTVLPVSGAGQVAQTSSTNFVYTPTGSGSSSGDYIWMRSPEVTLASGIHQLRIAYLFSTNSSFAKRFDTLQVFWAGNADG